MREMAFNGLKLRPFTCFTRRPQKSHSASSEKPIKASDAKERESLMGKCSNLRDASEAVHNFYPANVLIPVGPILNIPFDDFFYSFLHYVPSHISSPPSPVGM